MKLKLEDYQLKNTPLHINLMEIFSSSAHALCVSDISEKLTESCNESSLFRALKRFQEKKIIKISFIHEKLGTFYELSASHNHYVRCRVCGDLEAISSCSINPMIEQARAMGFTNINHRLEMIGECRQCA